MADGIANFFSEFFLTVLRISIIWVDVVRFQDFSVLLHPVATVVQSACDGVLDVIPDTVQFAVAD